MTEQLYPMIPPLELLKKWEDDWFAERQNVDLLLIQAYQAGADAEMEACCRQLTDPEWYDEIKNLRGPFRAAELRAARRPKPKSLKEQALQELAKVDMLWATEEFGQETLNSLNTIRKALETLPDD